MSPERPRKATIRRAFRELRGQAVKTGFGVFGE
jgi:hypothetical protein